MLIDLYQNWPELRLIATKSFFQNNFTSNINLNVWNEARALENSVDCSSADRRLFQFYGWMFYKWNVMTLIGANELDRIGRTPNATGCVEVCSLGVCLCAPLSMIAYC